VVTDWEGWCRGASGITAEGNTVVVETSGSRRQAIRVTETGDTLEFAGVVARAAAIDHLEERSVRLWRRNRSAQLVGYRRDEKGRLVGEAWIPKAGLTREEFLSCLRHVAAECDLFEFHLTGQDQE